MTTETKSKTPREIVEDTLTKERTRELWTANYFPAIPFSTQNFEIGALLPAMLYMARFGQRRGAGSFVKTFGHNANISNVAEILLKNDQSNLIGFANPTGLLVLGDLLLAGSLENRNHALGQHEPVMRVFPSHYLACWLDLPMYVSDLRGVPEFLTALLANQDQGEWLDPGVKTGNFSIGVQYTDNILLTLFGTAMQVGDRPTGDKFDESAAKNLGVEELLAVRLAQTCKNAPLKSHYKTTETISNRQPLAREAAKFMRDDLAIFITAYGAAIPRQTFLQMLEAGIALGLLNLLLSSMHVLEMWERDGKLPTTQAPWPLFVDCSNGQDKKLQDRSEQSMVECIRRYERLPVRTMLLRVLDEAVTGDEELKTELPGAFPDATARINFLGKIYHEHHPAASLLLRDLKKNCQQLADALEKHDQSPEIITHLREKEVSPALRLAEALCALIGDGLQRGKFMGLLDSILLPNEPSGLTIKRQAKRTSSGANRSVMLYALVMQPLLLDFLVHRYLRQTTPGYWQQTLSLQGFLRLLRERYGLYIDQEPPGQQVSQTLLLNNKAFLERRLRDMGLLIGVNDAESMKQLQPRYIGVDNG